MGKFSEVNLAYEVNNEDACKDLLCAVVEKAAQDFRRSMRGVARCKERLEKNPHDELAIKRLNRHRYRIIEVNRFFNGTKSNTVKFIHEQLKKEFGIA